MNIPFEDYSIEELIKLRNSIDYYIKSKEVDYKTDLITLNTSISSGFTSIPINYNSMIEDNFINTESSCYCYINKKNNKSRGLSSYLDYNLNQLYE